MAAPPPDLSPSALAAAEARYKQLGSPGGSFAEWWLLESTPPAGRLSHPAAKMALNAQDEWAAERGVREQAAGRLREQMTKDLTIRPETAALDAEARARDAQARAAESAPVNAASQAAYELYRRGLGAAVNPLDAFSGDPTRSLRLGLGVKPGTVGRTLQMYNLLPREVDNPPPPPGQPAERQPVVGDRSGEILPGSMRPEDVAMLGRGAFGVLAASPGGFKHTATVETEGHEVPKEAKEHFNAAYAAGGAANRAAMETELERSRVEEEDARSYANRLSAFQDQQARNEAARQQRLRDTENEMEAALKENNSPGAVVGKAIGGLFAAVGVAMGAYAATMTGQRNHALDALNSFTENELKRQRMEADRQDNFFARMRARFGDERMAEEATRLGILEQFRAQSAQTAAKLKGREAEAKFQKLNEALEQKRGEHLTNVKLLSDGQRQNTYQLVPPSLLTGSGGMGGGGGGGKGLGGGLKASPHVLNPYEAGEHRGASLNELKPELQKALTNVYPEVVAMDKFLGADAKTMLQKMNRPEFRLLDAIDTSTAVGKEKHLQGYRMMSPEQRSAYDQRVSFRNMRTRLLAGAAISGIEKDIIEKAQGLSDEAFVHYWLNTLRPQVMNQVNFAFAALDDTSGRRYQQATGNPGLVDPSKATAPLVREP